MITVKDDQVPASGSYKFSFKDPKGRAAKVDGVPTIESTDPTVLDTIGPVTDNGDGTFSAPLHSTDTVGTSQIKVTADVDLGSGTNTQEFFDVWNVIPGDASAMVGALDGALTPDPAPAP